jgi:hypothetical protein
MSDSEWQGEGCVDRIFQLNYHPLAETAAVPLWQGDKMRARQTSCLCLRPLSRKRVKTV